MKMLQKLWDVAEQEETRSGRNEGELFGSLGLFLVRPLKRFDYDSTPLNSLTFATTGGDGVHYGFLLLSEDLDEVPIVMTVPCAFDNGQNFIVGRNLLDFLCLGFHNGYFNFEQLAYYRPDALQSMEKSDELWEEAREDLKLLVESFNLQPWTQVDEKLRELDAAYSHLLQLPPPQT